jgi:hypothetical protein
MIKHPDLSLPSVCIFIHSILLALLPLGPGLGGCSGCTKKEYPNVPLLFNIEEDPSEAYPLTEDDKMPTDPGLVAVIREINAAYKHEKATFVHGKLVAPPLMPDEIKSLPGVCCDATKDGGSKAPQDATCDCDGAPYGPTPSPSPPSPAPRPMPPTPASPSPVPKANFLGCYHDHNAAPVMAVPGGVVRASASKDLKCDLNATVQATSHCSNEDPNSPGRRG